MKLLDTIKERYSVKNDAELSRLLKTKAPTISKIRSGKVSVSADMILRIHETFEMSIKEIRELL
jgi:plasmid maintenance system antidote protein VapI